MRLSAQWLDTVWKPAAWLGWALKSQCHMFTLPGVTGANVVIDWMHAAYLGAYQYVVASVFYLLCFSIMPGTPKQNLERCWLFIKQFYKTAKTRHRYRYCNKLSMFVRKTGFPKLRGKAAKINGIVPAIQALWQNCMSVRITVHKKINTMLKQIALAESILSEHIGEVALPAPSADKFKHAVFAFCQLHVQLSEHFENEGVKVFNVTAKSHMLLHAALLSKYLNPVLVWCFKRRGFHAEITENCKDAPERQQDVSSYHKDGTSL